MTDYSAAIESVLAEFGIDALVDSIAQGPSVIRYELKLGTGVRVEKVAKLQQQIAYATAASSVRILAPIPGKTAVGIELPRPDRQTIALADVLAAIPRDAHPLTVALGETVDGERLSLNLAKMPHLLVAGATGAGKSTFVNSMLVSLLKRTTPEQVQLTLIDPKRVELKPYEGVAHLTRPVITEMGEAASALNGMVQLMEARYAAMSAAGVRHIDDLGGYPYQVIVVDELADLMLQAKGAIEPPLVRLAQKGRAAGVHVVVATQRPSVDVISGLIRANFPSRLAFAVQSGVNSRIILDENGAEQLLGMGDGLFLPVGEREPIRVQGAYVSDAEVAEAVAERTVKVETVKPEGGKVAELIEYGEKALKRLDDYLDVLNKSVAERMDFDTPVELSKAATALDWLVRGLKDISVGMDVNAGIR